MKQIQLCFYRSCSKKGFNCLTKYSSFFHLLTLQPDQGPHTAGRCREIPQPEKIIHAGQRQTLTPGLELLFPRTLKSTYRGSKIISEISFLTKVLFLPEQRIKWSNLEREKEQRSKYISNNSLPGTQKIPEGESSISESWMGLESSERFECFPSRKTILDQLPRGGSLWFVIGVLALTPSPGTAITLSTCWHKVRVEQLKAPTPTLPPPPRPSSWRAARARAGVRAHLLSQARSSALSALSAPLLPLLSHSQTAPNSRLSHFL